MLIRTLNYNFIAFLAMILQKHCKEWHFMSIINNNYLKTSIVQHIKALFGNPKQALFVI